MPEVSKPTWDKLNKLSEKQLHKLADLMGVGFLNKPEDKDELILILSTESELKVLKALKQLKAY